MLSVIAPSLKPERSHSLPHPLRGQAGSERSGEDVKDRYSEERWEEETEKLAVSFGPRSSHLRRTVNAPLARKLQASAHHPFPPITSLPFSRLGREYSFDGIAASRSGDMDRDVRRILEYAPPAEVEPAD